MNKVNKITFSKQNAQYTSKKFSNEYKSHASLVWEKIFCFAQDCLLAPFFAPFWVDALRQCIPRKVANTSGWKVQEQLIWDLSWGDRWHKLHQGIGVEITSSVDFVVFDILFCNIASNLLDVVHRPLIFLLNMML